MINFYDHYAIYGPALVAGGILFRNVFVPFSFFLYNLHLGKLKIFSYHILYPP